MLVAGQEQLVAHRAIGRNQVVTRKRHSVHHLVIFRNVGIQYPKRADNLATDIRQEGILYIVSCTESFENLTRIIGNRCGINSMRSEFSKRELQLDELIAAVGSPISAATENQQQPI